MRRGLWRSVACSRAACSAARWAAAFYSRAHVWRVCSSMIYNKAGLSMGKMSSLGRAWSPQVRM